MRILILSFYYAPDLSAGSFRAKAFVEELSRCINGDDKVEIITTKPNRYESFSKDAKEFEKVQENIEINRIDVGIHKNGLIDQSKLFLKFAWKVLGLIRGRERYDIVYATSSRLMTAFLGSLIANRQKSKLYLDIRDIFTDTLKSIFAKSKLRYSIFVLEKIEKYTMSSASHINLVSKGFQDHFRNLNNNVSYSFHTNGIDDIFLNYDFVKQKQSEKKIITYAGNIGEGQGLEKIIPKMAKRLGATFEIHIVGDGGRKKALIESVKDIDNVRLFNPISRAELLGVYKNSDILFLHLNDYDAFKKVLPSKLFEYAATGKFIIAGIGGYAAEFVRENISGAIVFSPCSVDDFCKKFESIKNFNSIDRSIFVEKFKRENIMKALSEEVYGL